MPSESKDNNVAVLKSFSDTASTSPTAEQSSSNLSSLLQLAIHKAQKGNQRAHVSTGGGSNAVNRL
jgi:hypothetical protein